MDPSLLAQNESDLCATLNRLIHYAGQVGLKINTAKTKLMRIDPKSKHETILHVGDEIIEDVDEFCYRGSIISKNGGADSASTNTYKES